MSFSNASAGSAGTVLPRDLLGKGPVTLPDLGQENEIASQSSGESGGPDDNGPKQPKLKNGPPIPITGITEEVKATQQERVAKVLLKRQAHDKRLISYDLTGARSRPRVGFVVPKLDRLPAAEAGALLHRIHMKAGIQDATEEVLWAFDKALFFYHTINGGSFIQEGDDSKYLHVVNPYGADPVVLRIKEFMDILGFNARRFWRAFSDVITDVNREIIAEKDSGDEDAKDRYDQLIQVAFQRGMVRYPELCHDSADACARLTLEERATVLASKTKVLANSSKTAQETNPYYKVET